MNDETIETYVAYMYVLCPCTYTYEHTMIVKVAGGGRWAVGDDQVSVCHGATCDFWTMLNMRNAQPKAD